MAVRRRGWFKRDVYFHGQEILQSASQQGDRRGYVLPRNAILGLTSAPRLGARVHVWGRMLINIDIVLIAQK